MDMYLKLCFRVTANNRKLYFSVQAKIHVIGVYRYDVTSGRNALRNACQI